MQHGDRLFDLRIRRLNGPREAQAKRCCSDKE
jgi:hypothetical protein